jgi:hypothetical protein
MSVLRPLSAASALFILFTAAGATRYAGDFEELGASARIIGMGGAAAANADDASTIYYNPSLSSRLSRTSALFLHSEEFSGLVKHNFLGVSFASCLQSFGFAVLHNGIPGIKLTALPYPDLPPSDTNRPCVTEVVSANQLVGYVNYSRTLTPALSVGGNCKLIYQNLGVGSCFGMGIDLGLAVVPLKGMSVGLRLRNASTAPLFWDTGTREYVAPSVGLGVAKTFPLGRDRLTLAAESQADIETGSLLPELGVEYVFRNVLAGRLGAYRGNFAFGVGLRIGRFHLDYGYAAAAAPGARELGSPQQISGGVEF